MEILDQQSLRNTRGGSVWFTALRVAYEAYREQLKKEQWNGGQSGGGGAGVDW